MKRTSAADVQNRKRSRDDSIANAEHNNKTSEPVKAKTSGESASQAKRHKANTPAKRSSSDQFEDVESISGKEIAQEKEKEINSAFQLPSCLSYLPNELKEALLDTDQKHRERKQDSVVYIILNSQLEDSPTRELSKHFHGVFATVGAANIAALKILIESEDEQPEFAARWKAKGDDDFSGWWIDGHGCLKAGWDISGDQSGPGYGCEDWVGVEVLKQTVQT